jgi:two-component system chemotaxis response regulator CheB
VIKVLIVDDSALVRQMLKSMLDLDSDIQVVGVASDPYVAREKIKKLNPDVLTLDIEMPRMDGLTFLGNLMRLRPMPVVMVSTLTDEGAEVTLKALEYGAVDYVSEPKLDVAEQLPEYFEEIITKVKTAARIRIASLERKDIKIKISEKGKYKSNEILQKTTGHQFKTTDRIIGIGSSTGGTEAIKEVVAELPSNMPGIVISQHIPESFSGPFAKRVNSITRLTVFEAKDCQQILPGCVYIAPGNRHLLVKRDGARYICRLNDGKPVNRHKPSVDVMFRSLAQNAGSNAIGLMLTGMGSDGAEGIGEMKNKGALTLVQDEKSSVVWGMPGEAVKRGYVDEIIALNKIGERLVELSAC